MKSNNRVVIIGCLIHNKSIRRLLPLQNSCTKIPLCPFPAHTHVFFHIKYTKKQKRKIRKLTNCKDLEKGCLRIGGFSFVSHDFAEIDLFLKRLDLFEKYLYEKNNQPNLQGIGKTKSYIKRSIAISCYQRNLFSFYLFFISSNFPFHCLNRK